MDRKIKKKKWTLKKIVSLIIAGTFIIIVIYNFLFGDHSSKLNIKTERITISKVKKGPFQEFIPVTGTVIPIKTIYLDAIEGGRVDTIYLEAGSFVKQSDEILMLGNTKLLLDILYREADLAEQSNNLRNTRLEMERNRLNLQSQLIELDYQIKKQKRIHEANEMLLEKQLIPRREYEEIRDDYEYMIKKRKLTLERHQQDSIYRKVQIQNLESSLERMQASLQLVKRNLENLVIKAPISGHLTSLNAEVGQSISQGERIGQIDVLEGFKVRVSVDEHYIARINIGQQGTFDFTGETYRMEIKKVYPEVIEGRFEVDMEFDGTEPEGIRRGQTLHIQLELGDLSEALLVDRGGFYQKTGGQWIYVVNKSGTLAEKRRIKLGRQNPKVFEVLDGLKDGEQVITSSYDSYGDIDKLILKH